MDRDDFDKYVYLRLGESTAASSGLTGGPGENTVSFGCHGVRQA